MIWGVADPNWTLNYHSKIIIVAIPRTLLQKVQYVLLRFIYIFNTVKSYIANILTLPFIMHFNVYLTISDVFLLR